MTKPLDPYSRVYWRIAEDPRFETIYPDDRHLATWLRLLMLADAVYPTAAPIPANARRASVKALGASGLIDLLPGGLFRVHGLQAERERRADASRIGAEARWAGNAKAMPTHSDRIANGMPDELRRDETRTSQDETRNARPKPVEVEGEDPFGVSEDEARVFAFIAGHGASIRPDAPLGRRLLGLLERRGVEDVLRQAGSLARQNGAMSDRQWVLGLENIIELLPSPKGAREIDTAEEDAKRAKRRDEAVWERRMESWRNGVWHPEWGDPPASA